MAELSPLQQSHKLPSASFPTPHRRTPPDTSHPDPPGLHPCPLPFPRNPSYATSLPHTTHRFPRNPSNPAARSGSPPRSRSTASLAAATASGPDFEAFCRSVRAILKRWKSSFRRRFWVVLVRFPVSRCCPSILYLYFLGDGVRARTVGHSLLLEIQGRMEIEIEGVNIPRRSPCTAPRPGSTRSACSPAPRRT